MKREGRKGIQDRRQDTRDTGAENVFHTWRIKGEYMAGGCGKLGPEKNVIQLELCLCSILNAIFRNELMSLETLSHQSFPGQPQGDKSLEYL